MLGVEAEAGFGEPVHATPDQAIDGDDDDGHDERRSTSRREVACVGGARDGRAQSDRVIGLVLEAKVLGNDAGVPRASGSGDQAGNEVGEDSRAESVCASAPSHEAEHLGGFFQVRGNRHRSGDHVEQDVPLRPEQQQDDGGRPSPPPMRISISSTMGNKRGGRNGRGDLRQRLRDLRQPRLKPMATPAGIVHSAADQQCDIHAQEGRDQAAPDFADTRRASCR